MLMKDNTKLYRKVRLLRLQTNDSKPQPQAHLGLETLANVATNFFDIPESSTQKDEEPDTIQATEASQEKI